MRSMLSILLFPALLALGCAHDKYTLAANHLGYINAPCTGLTKEACATKIGLSEMESCVKIDMPCAGGDRLLDELFEPNRHTKFANYIVYFDQDHTPGRFNYRRPVLMWNRRNTRYLYGVQEVYILLVTEYKACFEAQLSTVAKNEPNPFEALLKIVGKSVGTAESQPSLKTHAAQFLWYPLSGDAEEPVMWLVIGSVPVDINTTDWITVRFADPKPKSDKTAGLPDECVIQEGQRAVKYKASFLAHNAFFSDNRETHFAVAVGLGATFTGRDAGPRGPNSPNFNGYVFGKYYPIARFRPTIISDPNYTGGAIKSRQSFAVVAGTGIISGSTFDELIAGISIGHVMGNVGFIGGVNFFVPASSTTTSTTKVDTTPTRRQRQPFFAVEYSF